MIQAILPSGLNEAVAGILNKYGVGPVPPGSEKVIKDAYKDISEGIGKLLIEAASAEDFKQQIYDYSVTQFEYGTTWEDLKEAMKMKSLGEPYEDFLDSKRYHACPGFGGTIDDYEEIAKEIFALREKYFNLQ